MDLGLAGAAVCISGGSKGLGREAALAFAREGARVVIMARGADGLHGSVAALLAAGAADAFGVETNVARLDSIDAAFAQIAAKWNELNTLVNMVGPTEPSAGRDFAEVPDHQWQFYFDVGIMSVVRCTRAALPLMRKAAWGRVINISSISARVGQAFEAPYMSAKAGLNALSKNMAWALAKEGILVNTVTPGVFQTEALRTFMEMTGATATYNPDNLAEIWDWMRNVSGPRPAGAIARVALPQELSPLLLLLGSRANSYIVGANIAIDGGTDFSPG
jgi:NAD(P)-dependent dehydrogenase (short-subunit alcohol dehydrogenase family)